MRFPTLTAALAALCLALPATAQKVQVFGGNGTRAATTMILFGENLMAGVCVTHGQPEWKEEYDGMLDKLKGKLLRLGKDWWTTWSANTDVELNGVMIPAGEYICGLACDKDGKFTLALLDASQAMKQKLVPFGPQTWQPTISVPLELKKGTAAAVVDKMTMTLKGDEKNPAQGTFTIAWGKHELVAAAKLPAAAGDAKTEKTGK